MLLSLEKPPRLFLKPSNSGCKRVTRRSCVFSVHVHTHDWLCLALEDGTRLVEELKVERRQVEQAELRLQQEREETQRAHERQMERRRQEEEEKDKLVGCERMRGQARGSASVCRDDETRGSIDLCSTCGV